MGVRVGGEVGEAGGGTQKLVAKSQSGTAIDSNVHRSVLVNRSKGTKEFTACAAAPLTSKGTGNRNSDGIPVPSPSVLLIPSVADASVRHGRVPNARSGKAPVVVLRVRVASVRVSINLFRRRIGAPLRQVRDTKRKVNVPGIRHDSPRNGPSSVVIDSGIAMRPHSLIQNG